MIECTKRDERGFYLGYAIDKGIVYLAIDSDGIDLIKNAISQGNKSADHIRKKIEEIDTQLRMSIQELFL
jgi:hypothetical protein